MMMMIYILDSIHDIVWSFHINLQAGTSADLILLKKDERFIKLEVKEDCELKTFIQDHSLTFQRGAAFYEFTRAEEDVKVDKEVILMDKV